MLKITRFLFLTTVCLAALSGPSFAQQEADARLNRLENEIQTLSRAVFRNELPPQDQMQAMSGAGTGANPAAQANLELRISQLEMEVSTLTGKLEQQNFELRQIQEKFDKAMADLDMRVTEAESRGTATAGTAPAQRSAMAMQGFDTNLQDVPPAPAPAQPGQAQPATAAGAQQLGSLTQSPDGKFNSSGDAPADAYEQAYARMRDKDYDAAEKGFTDFLARYPGHDLAANAKYWLGETYYVRGNFERAARVFAEAYQLYPKGPKGPDNLLKLALSLNGLGKKDDACLTLTQLKREYPVGAAPVLARADREWTNIGCK